jgi:hypothetical protein
MMVWRTARRELLPAILFAASGMLVGVIVLIWRGDVRGAFVIGGSIALCLSLPACLARRAASALFKLDRKLRLTVNVACRYFCGCHLFHERLVLRRASQ